MLFHILTLNAIVPQALVTIAATRKNVRLFLYWTSNGITHQMIEVLFNVHCLKHTSRLYSITYDHYLMRIRYYPHSVVSIS